MRAAEKSPRSYASSFTAASMQRSSPKAFTWDMFPCEVLDISINGSGGDCVSADATATAYIEDIKYCPFCGEEL